MMNRLGRIARTIEFTVAGLITAGIVVLHLSVMQHAGPLWRDEISSVRVATMPTLGGLWSALVYDPVPAFFFALLRCWNWICSGASDESLRHLGFGIGLGVTAALWISAWSMKKAPPLWALLLFGLSPVALVWGDSMRAYGLGCLFNILAVGCIWRATCEQPRAAQIVGAAVTVLGSVQCLFPNSLLVFAAISGATVVAITQRWWRTALIMPGIGLGAALSLLPYAGIIHSTQSWSKLCSAGVNSTWIFTMLYRTLLSGGQLAANLWMAGAAMALLLLLLAAVRPRLLRMDAEDRNLAMYAGITLSIAAAATICFLTWVGWATSLWYYLPVMSTAVVCIDSVSRLTRKSAIASMLNSLLVLVAAMALSPVALQATAVRLTNVDLTTRALTQLAQPDDLIVVDNYFYGISFNRYYHGRTPWVSVPNLDDFTLHRWDLLTESMRRLHPIEPVVERIDQTLKAGHDVYVVGFAFTNPGAVPPLDLPVAPARGSAWCLWPYVRQWPQQIAYAVRSHGEHGKIVSVRCEQPISIVENVRTIVVSGWKETKMAALP
jgi:hypothetical protein